MLTMHEALKAVVGNSAEAAVSVQWGESIFRATLSGKNEQIRPATNAVGGCRQHGLRPYFGSRRLLV